MILGVIVKFLILSNTLYWNQRCIQGKRVTVRKSVLKLSSFTYSMAIFGEKFVFFNNMQEWH